MNIGGLAGRAALLKKALHDKRCPRCHLHYDSAKHKTCPHCGSLNESELEQFLFQREQQAESNRSLGLRFLAVTLLLSVIFLLLFIGD